MGFVLKLKQPLLFLAVDVHLDFDRAGVDLFRFVQRTEQTLLFECLCADGRQIHQGHRFVFACVQGLSQLEVFIVSVLDVIALDVHLLDVGGEGGVTAMVGPIGVDHANLGDGRSALFGFFKVFLTEGDVAQIHRQTVLVDEFLQALLVQLAEAFQDRYVSRHVKWGMQSLW